MMLYTFVKDSNGNVERIGVECSAPAELQEKLKPYSEKGFVPALDTEYDTQMNIPLQRAEEKIAELEAELTEGIADLEKALEREKAKIEAIKEICLGEEKEEVSVE